MEFCPIDLLFNSFFIPLVFCLFVGFLYDKVWSDGILVLWVNWLDECFFDGVLFHKIYNRLLSSDLLQNVFLHSSSMSAA